MERRFYAMRLWYEGGPFRGYQRQPGLPTVQGALEQAMRRAGICAHLSAAARTDAGAHALAQVVSFAVREALDPEAFRHEVNRSLPEGIAVLHVRPERRGFHARASALSRTYVYLVGAGLPEGLRPYAWSLPDARAFPETKVESPDAKVMRAALSQSLGEHDFAGFSRFGSRRVRARRTLLRAEIHSASWVPLHAVVLEGNGFSRAMVRNLVGTVVAAGLGLERPGRVGEILSAPTRYRGVRAPGSGLTLAAVSYPPSAG